MSWRQQAHACSRAISNAVVLFLSLKERCVLVNLCVQLGELLLEGAIFV